MKRALIIHPFLFALYPLLSVLAVSLPILHHISVLRPLLIVIFICLFILLTLYWLYKDWYRAGFLTSVVIMMLFYYGYSYRIPQVIHIFNLPISRHLIILCFWAIFLGILASTWLWKRVRPPVITNFMNITSGLAFMYAIFLLGSVFFRLHQDPLVNWSRPPNPSEDSTQLTSVTTPDIYYFILDGYARSDILQQIYNFDNTDFYDKLKDRGFYIAEQSRSNYAGTPLSLASALNFEYLDYFAFAGGKSINSVPLNDLVINSRVRDWLEHAGYHVYLSSEYLFAQSTNPAVVFYSPQKEKLTIFESLLLETSMFEIIVDLGKVNVLPYSYEKHREQILNGFAEAEYLVKKDSPKFIFVHVLAPHPPFVFDADGNPVQPDWEYNVFDGLVYKGSFEEYINGYVQQLMYINHKILETIDYILLNSSTPPIIILQADHGPAALIGNSVDSSCLSERFSILNAYYFPDGKIKEIYSSITPVNTFRVIFNSYFGANLALLPDQNYFSTNDDFYQFSNVTNEVDTLCEIP